MVSESQTFFIKSIDFWEFTVIIIIVSTQSFRVLILENNNKGGALMELSERKKAILAAIVKTYITTGEPIGSKNLCDILDNSPSSATLRNEMSALVQMGYLEQPHTSAGRVPTPTGYKFYIDSLMQKSLISDEYKSIIDHNLKFTSCDPEILPKKAGEVLSGLTGLPTFTAHISGDTRLKKVEAIPFGHQSVMLLIITSDGRSRSRLCHIQNTFDNDLRIKFNRFISERIVGKTANELSPAVMQNMFSVIGADAFLLMPLLTSIFEMINDINESTVNLSGQSNLFSMYSQKADAERIINLLKSREALLPILNRSNEPVEIVFGNQTPFSALEPSSIILAKYSAGKHNLGCIGVIGPTRMSYEQIIPSIEYTAKRLSEILDTVLFDMEE